LNKKKLLQFQIFAIVFSVFLGTLLHFTYKWAEEDCFIAIFSSVNESTWEHLKLAFYPMLIILIIGYFYIGKKYIFAQTVGILATLTFITVFFYTYIGVIGRGVSILNILIFIIGIIIGEFLTYKIIIKNENIISRECNIISVLTIIILLFSFIIFTFEAPEIDLFKDPITNIYGIG